MVFSLSPSQFQMCFPDSLPVVFQLTPHCPVVFQIYSPKEFLTVSHLLSNCFRAASQMWFPSCLLDVSQVRLPRCCLQGFYTCWWVVQLSPRCGLPIVSHMWFPRCCLPVVSNALHMSPSLAGGVRLSGCLLPVAPKVSQLLPSLLHLLSGFPPVSQMWSPSCLLDVSQVRLPRCCLPVASKVSTLVV